MSDKLTTFAQANARIMRRPLRRSTARPRRQITGASRTDWALGIQARSHALLRVLPNGVAAVRPG
jgi:hypothetical protein